MLFPKPQRTRCADTLAYVRRLPCAVCSRRPADPAHVISRGAGGTDKLPNVYPLCREHHTEQHQIGWPAFYARHAKLRLEMEGDGWHVEDGRLRNAAV